MRLVLQNVHLIVHLNYRFMKYFSYLFSTLLAAMLLAACGEDRSGEQPFAPTLGEMSAVVMADSVRLTGIVTASPNSTLLECGFTYGNDTLRGKVQAPVLTSQFSVTIDSLLPGNYFAVGYAKNGVGTTYADTLRFTIE